MCHACNLWCVCVVLLPGVVFGAEPDVSTPVAAMKSFYTAIADHNVKAAQSLSLAGDDEIKFIKTSVEMEKAITHLVKAANEKLGEEGKKLTIAPPAAQLLKLIDKVEPKMVDENHAELSLSTKGPPQRLTRIDGAWKVDLAASFNETGAKDVAGLFGKIAAYMEEIAADIDAGKITTVADMQQEMRRRRRALDVELMERK